jgi:hypothetical protein
MSRIGVGEWERLEAAAKRLESLHIAGPWTQKPDGAWIRRRGGVGRGVVAIVREEPRSRRMLGDRRLWMWLAMRRLSDARSDVDGTWARLWALL